MLRFSQKIYSLTCYGLQGKPYSDRMVPNLDEERTHDSIKVNPEEFDHQVISIWDQPESDSKCVAAVFKIFKDQDEAIAKSVHTWALLRLIDKETIS